MKVIIIGGTGFLGKHLITRMLENNYEISVIGRNFSDELFRDSRLSIIKANTTVQGSWQDDVVKNEIVINLAGASIFTRWSNKAKNEIYETRILTTKNIVEAFQFRSLPMRYLLNASAVGYYGDGHDDILDEKSPAGDDFLSNLSRDWEDEALKAESKNTHVVTMRFGIILGRHGGAFSKLKTLFKYLLGAELGNGKQWFSWIHEDDLVNAMLFLIQKQSLQGPINMTSPNPITNSELTQTLARVVKRPLILPPAPAFIMKSILGEFSDVLLKGQRVKPKKLQSEGFNFLFPTLEEALRDLLKQ